MKLALPVLLAAILALPHSLVAQKPPKPQSRPAKPNLVLVMVDDMGLGDTSAYKGIRLGENAKPIGKTLGKERRTFLG